MANVNKAQVNGTNRTKSTISFWIKRGKISTDQKVFQFKYGSAEYLMKFKSNDQVNVYSHDGSSYIARIETNNIFKDPASFYHFHIQVDTTDSTSANRFRFYVNNELQDNLLNSDVPSQNANFDLSTSNYHLYLGSQSNGGDAFDGTITHFHYTDGYSYAPTVFGETDSTSGIWKPKTAPSVTYGTNGVFLKFENSGAMGTDSSGNSNTYTVSGTLTQNVDTPSNNFCTLNRLDRARNNTNNLGDALENGNTTFNTASSNNIVAKSRGTFGVTSGKYYWEGKYGGGTSWVMGICLESIFADTTAQFWDSSSILAVGINGGSGTLYVSGRSSDSWNTGVSFSSGDIFGFALDVDNKALYIHRNGTYLTANSNVGVPTSGASRTGSVLGELTTGGYQNYIPDGQVVFPFAADIASGNSATMYMNFGRGYFGTTQVASAGTAPSEGGIFEYDCPSGYQALCTKGINSF